MGYYSIWLEQYLTCRDRILEDIQSYKTEVDSLKAVIKEKNLLTEINDSGGMNNGLMCFVDGGEGIKELLGAAIYFIRASGLVIKKTAQKFHNEEFVRDVGMGLLDYDDHTKERIELLRGAMEFDVASRSIDEHTPEYVFIDGSLYVNSRKRPTECDEYPIYRKKFTRLLKKCRENNIHLVGVSEDSKSRLFSNYLSTKYDIKMPGFMTDSSILRVLSGNKKYRTVEFTPSSRFEADRGSLTASFPTVYLQPTRFSNPLRVDVPSWETDFPGVIDLVADLCRGSNHYGYPLPMYLVHLDARIEKKHADWSAMQLLHHLSREDPSLMDSVLNKTRRDLRPID